MLTQEYLQQKRDEYEDAYMQHLNAANANHGAMLAIDDLIAELDKQKAASDDGTSSHDH